MTIAPDAPLLTALTPHIQAIITAAIVLPRYDQELRAFWLTK